MLEIARFSLALYLFSIYIFFQFDEQDDIEFRMPSRYSTSYDYDSTLDSPTVRSSVSTHPADDDAVVADRVSEVWRNLGAIAEYPQLPYDVSEPGVKTIDTIVI